ncbi:Actin 7 isoform 1 [Hibiscus syriacus]|uniref:RING-type E3 ubiquitin transferase n=1 Tax=Hibiscus syriacus TaxID=106335 RepID=A0A6A3A6A4_HIBSY|nr:RING-H2 finger protein ATL79-like [Hibiscus syriacus]KAE8699841.1 Actin 7 isoform 1 [Hibiscus syriacus]
MPIKNTSPRFISDAILFFSHNPKLERKRKTKIRPPPAPAVSSGEPPLTSSTSNSTCSPHVCRWQPYTNSNNFQDNVATVLIILFCALICSVVLNATIRCFLRGILGGGEHHPWRFGVGRHLPRTQQELGERKPVPEAGTSRLVVVPTVVYSGGMKLAGAEGGEPECAICLSELEEGDGIQVLAKCKHAFHVQCIKRWLVSNSSCPTCHCSCLPPSLTPEETTHQRIDDGSRRCRTRNHSKIWLLFCIPYLISVIHLFFRLPS